MPATQAAAQPLSIAFPPDQIDWLTAQARARRISRSALIRQAVDLLIQQQHRSSSHD